MRPKYIFSLTNLGRANLISLVFLFKLKLRLMKIYFAIAVLFFLSSCNTNNDTPATTKTTKTEPGLPEPKIINLNIIGIYPHDTSAYTQGLEIHNGKFYEGTGDYINSSLRITDIKSGKVEHKHMMGTADVFGEGITIYKNKIYQLTWKNHLVNVYDLQNIDKPIKTFNWPYEGWGITHNDSELVISDGSSNLYFVNPDDFKVKSARQVTDNLGPMDAINELEYIDGFVFANIYGSDIIIKIDPNNGHIVGKINLPGIIQQYDKNYTPGEGEVLNGIAWDSNAKKLYITGKRWPKMFEALIN